MELIIDNFQAGPDTDKSLVKDIHIKHVIISFSYGVGCYWAVCRVHSGGSNVLFGDGHVEWKKPDEYHSNTIDVDENGYPIPSSPVIAPNWREYWDTSY